MLGSAGALAQPLAAPTVDSFPFSAPPGSDKPLMLDLYRPAGTRGPLPVIIFIHGGGFVLGDRSMSPDLRRYFARDGFAMASIDYRLLPGTPFPGAIEDVRTAVRWLRANANRLGLDPRHIGLWGTSAGAYLATMAGLAPPELYTGVEHGEQSSAVSCVLDGYGPTDFAQLDAQRAAAAATLEPLTRGIDALPNPAVESERQMTAEVRTLFARGAAAFLGGSREEIPDIWRASNPAIHARRDAPAFLIMHGLSDRAIPHAQSVLLYEALAAADTDVTLRLIHGLPHTFFNMPGIDEAAGPFRMDVRQHRSGQAEQRTGEIGMLFDSARSFFRSQLMRR